MFNFVLHFHFFMANDKNTLKLPADYDLPLKNVNACALIHVVFQGFRKKNTICHIFYQSRECSLAEV